MKRSLLTVVALLALNFSYSQYNSGAPWINELKKSISEEEMQQRNSAQPFTFYEVQEAFNKYWKTRDPNAKGSGYKPFKRWEHMVENEVDKNGYLPTAQDLWKAWEAKNQFQVSSAMADQSNWQPLGPFTTIGTGSWSTGQARINVVIIDPNNPTTWYVGAPAGGIWKSTDSGVNWIPLTDQLPQIGVSGIAIDHANSNIIYIATGDDDSNDSVSVGVFKSTDGGTTWNQTGLNPGNSPYLMNDIYINPTNSNMLWVATTSGVYKSTNAGVNWTQTLSGNIRDIKLKPGDPNIVYAVSSTRFYKSTNAGDSFSTISSGLPASSSLSRMVIDVTPADSNYVYVLAAGTGNAYNGVYRSTNSGTSFTAMNTSTDVLENTQSWYDLALGVSDTNKDQIFTGCLNVWRSNDGGASLTKINNWNSPGATTYTHADIHFLRAYNGTMYCGSDGGVYSSSDQGASFSNHTFGVQASQFYRVAVAKTNVNKMVGGLQDNGGHAFNDTSGQSKNYYGADGMDTAVDPTDENKFYGFIQSGGGPYISTDAGATLSSNVAGAEDGNWVTPMAINSTGKLYGGYSKLFRLDGASWTQLADLGGYCDYLEIAPSDDTVIYAAVNTVLKRSTDSGVSFTNIETFSSDIKGIGVNQTDPNIVWITTAGGGTRGVFKTTNALGGSTFTNITSNLPTSGDGVYYTDVVHQGGHSDNPIFLGTGLGVYRLDDTSTNWEPFMINLPNTQVSDLEINLNDESITAATYGRGVWRSPIPIQMAPNDVKLVAINNPNTTNINCQAVTPEITVKNNGLNTITQIDITYTVDGTPTGYTWNGTLLSTESTTITLPVLTVSRASHTLNIETTVIGDGNVTNNNSNLTFFANDSGSVNVTNTFENASDALLTDNALWEKGAPSDALLNSTSSGTQVYGTDLDANHPDNTKAHLVSQCYDLTSLVNPVLRFDMAFDLEENWDIAYVEYSTNKGQNWSILGTKNSQPLWYNSDRTNASSGAADDCQNCPGAQWTGEGEKTHGAGGTNATMREYAYDFATNAGIGETDLTGETNILFRIVFHSDASVNEEGITIDDFVIDGTLGIDDFETNSFMVYPNPSSGIVNIKFKEATTAVNFNVFDVTGKVIYTEQVKQFLNEYQLNLNKLSTGIYFLEIENNSKKVTQKVMIK